jgi:tRNA(adenine34) deaminase
MPAPPDSSRTFHPAAASELDPLMRECLREAEAAEREGEVPVGAVVVREGRIVGRGHNRPIAAHDPSAHAEVVALRAAGAALASYRLPDCELLVTVEPCVMCVGALLQARVRRVVFGCGDPKAGALGGLLDLGAQPGFNHRFEVVGGVLAEEAAALLRVFFRRRRRADGG